MERINLFMKRVVTFFVYSAIIVAIAYAGVCAYANIPAFNREPGEFTLPSVKQAQYEFAIKNTSNVIFSDSYDTEGRAYILHGYYELKDNKYRRNKGELTLDQEIFGTITVRRR